MVSAASCSSVAICVFSRLVKSPIIQLPSEAFVAAWLRLPVTHQVSRNRAAKRLLVRQSPPSPKGSPRCHARASSDSWPRDASLPCQQPLRTRRNLATVCGCGIVTECSLLAYRRRVVVIEAVLRGRLGVAVAPRLVKVVELGGKSGRGCWCRLSWLGVGVGVERVNDFGVDI